MKSTAAKPANASVANTHARPIPQLTSASQSGYLELAKTGHLIKPVEPLICSQAKSLPEGRKS
jgi:hypothetical protein